MDCDSSPKRLKTIAISGVDNAKESLQLETDQDIESLAIVLVCDSTNVEGDAESGTEDRLSY